MIPRESRIRPPMAHTAQITLTQPTIGISSNPADHRVRQHEGICQKDQKAQDGDVPDGPGGRAGNTF